MELQMSKKTEINDISKLSPQEREALAEELFEKAKDHKKRNHDDPDESDPVKLLDKAIELYQKPKYYFVKATELFQMYENWDDIDEMEELLNESPYNMPSSSDTDNSNNYRKLFELTAKALELNPKYSQAHYMNARLYNQLGEYSQALEEINQALSMRQDLYHYYDTHHEILINMGDLENALTVINKAIEIKPDGYKLTDHKYHLLLRMGRYQEALNFLKTFPVKENEDPLIVYFNLSIPLLLKMKNHERAHDVLLRVMDSSIWTSQFEYQLAELYREGEYHMLASLPMIKKMSLKVLWILFWSTIQNQDFCKARLFLEAINFNKGLTTDILDNEIIEFDDIPKADQNLHNAYEMSATWDRSWRVKYSISNLFSLSQPYEKVPMDIFLLLLRKIFDGRLAKQYFDQRLSKFQQQWVTEPELIAKRKTYGELYYDISLKIMLLGDVARFVYKLSKKKAVIFSLLQNAMNTSLMSAMNTIMLKVQLEERNRILANLSHSIKNMLKAVIDPLENLREELPQKAVIIDNAIKGANLIREIVNAINLSFKTTLDELQWDVQNIGGESMTLQDMVVDSLRYSVSNMFDSRYFPAFSENYFPRSVAKKQYEQIKSQWNDVSAGDVRLIKDFLDQHMFRLDLNLDESRDYHVGNEKSSAIKLLILFQEIIFNAVKYASYVSHSDRQVVIMLASHGDNLTLTVRNSFNPKVQAKTTGVGKVVIENFARVLGCEPMISTDSNTYSISLEFNNIWRNNAENFIH